MPHAATFYSLPSSSIDKEFIEKLEREYQDPSDFNEMIKNLKLQRINGFKQKFQKTGNCAWASSKIALRALCEWYTDRQTGNEIYKQFSAFTRMKILQDYLEHPHEPDRTLLQKIRAKYLTLLQKIRKNLIKKQMAFSIGLE